ncbi:DNA primase [Streptomyces sp. Q6]|uniref:DNA primase n=1 Tax=Streptomyces citrinus TaxID=3118173 RepID=A0ACD5AK74_9ACTN
MNRVALGLAVGAGYVLGRTKKMKLAFAVGTMVAGKRMKLSPRALADMVSQQLENNPQFKEIGDQLREDLRGVGKAASGALVERQIEGLAGRLHSRTQGVRDQISGVAPDVDDVRGAGERVTGTVVPGSRRSEEEPYDDEDEAYDDEVDARDAHDADEPDEDAPDQGARDADPHEADAHDEDAQDEDERPQRRAPRASSAAKKTSAASGKQSAAKQSTGGSRGAAKKTARTAKKTAGSAPRATTKGGRGRG